MSAPGERSSLNRAGPLTDHTPYYVQGTRRAEVWAHFPGGAIVPISRSRVRTYPGLTTEAPPTRSFYLALSELATSHQHVIDAGAGSGQGARALLDRFPRVTGIEKDPTAVFFARELVPEANFQQQDLEQQWQAAAADAAIVADTLGHVRHPEKALRQLRGQLAPQATVIIAEPRAHVSQTLRCPARRAFSQRTLEIHLVNAGFAVDGWLCDQGPFVACLARPGLDQCHAALVEAGRNWDDGNREGSLARYLTAQHSGNAQVVLEAIIGEARVHLARGEGDAAARALFRAREIRPNDPRSLVGLAQIARASGALDDALYLAMDAVNLDPTDVIAATSAAELSRLTSQPHTFSLWRIAARLAPDRLEIATQLAASAVASGDYEFCASVFDRVQQYGDSLSADFHATFAWLLLALERENEAAIEARIATTMAPDDPQIQALWDHISPRGPLMAQS